MNIMPESVQAALSALRHLQPADRDAARTALGLWARRAELSEIEVDRVLNYYFTGDPKNATIAKHYESGGWKGVEPGTCGVECACGVTYDGFDSLAEAAEFLARHIKTANSAAEVDESSAGVIEVADGHVVHLCCGKLDDQPHRNFCEHFRLPGTVAELRGAAVTALQPYKPLNREHAESMLHFWVRRPEMIAEDMAAVLDAMYPEPLPALNCPDWCTFEHDDGVADFDLVTHMGDDHLDGTGRKLLDGHKLEIRVARTDCLPEGTVGVPNLMVTCDLELTTWEQAAELARAILDGFGYLNGAEK